MQFAEFEWTPLADVAKYNGRVCVLSTDNFISLDLLLFAAGC